MRHPWKLIFSLIPAGVYLYLVFFLPGETYTNADQRRWLFASCALVGALLLRWAVPTLGWARSGLLAVLAYATLQRLAVFIPDVSTFPWSMGWSEGSRYYYASLFFSKSLYGINAPPSVLHPTRYLLQSIPFLIPGLPLWFHRLWQVLLWMVTTFGAGGLLVWRLRRRGVALKGFLSAFALACWTFLFLMQGPVYYHLLAMVLLVLWGVQTRRFVRTLIVVLIGSVWAGISRVNWFPMPGLLAAALYFLEQPVGQPDASGLWRKVQHWLSYLLPPAAWTFLGTGIAYLTQRLYIVWSGNPSSQFGTSFTSDLLWYRLFPNPTYPEGILRSTILVSIPLGTVLLYHVWKHHRAYHRLRLLGLGVILALLLAGGLVVSVKIGGGSNLHNLDVYLVMLWLVGAYAYFAAHGPEPPVREEAYQPPQRHVFEPFAWAVLLMPVMLMLPSGGPLPSHDTATAQHELALLESQLANAQGPVLFITQRHLLTFHTLQGIPLEPDYEVVFLMEMAMGNNQPYLQEFDQRLASHRYAYIVSDTINLQFKGSDFPFGEENDVWTVRVSEPLLCYYQPVLSLPYVNVQVLAPRATNCK